MPKTPKDYSKGLIYKLCCKDTSVKEIYVGSTTNFTQRKRAHKKDCNNPTCKQYNYKVYQFIRNNGNWDNWNIILIEYYPCETELELCRRENYFMTELQASLNTYKPHIYENAQDQSKEWRINNKERKKEMDKTYYENNKKAIIEKVKTYNQSNKEKSKEYFKKRYETNKEKILEKMKEKITCECGCDVSRGNMKRHEKSAKHISFISQKQNPLGQDIQEILS